MRLFIRPASEVRALEQGVALLMASYDAVPPHVADDEQREPGSCCVIVMDSADKLFDVLQAVAKVQASSRSSVA